MAPAYLTRCLFRKLPSLTVGFPTLTFNSERRVISRWLEVYLFQMSDRREPRAGRQVVSKRLDTRRRTFGECFHATVMKILHVTNNLMTGRGPLRKETEADALHVAADEESSRYFVRHLIFKGKRYLSARSQVEQPQCRRREFSWSPCRRRSVSESPEPDQTSTRSRF